LALLRDGKAPPGSSTPDGDFFWIPGADEGELARKAVRLIAERIPKRLGLTRAFASVALCGGEEGPLGTGPLSEAVRAALGVSDGNGLAMDGRILLPGDRVLLSADDPASGLARGDRGTVADSGPGAPYATVLAYGREARFGPETLGDLLPCWALPASEAPPWASFPAAVVALGRGSERRLDRAGLARAASLAESLLVITGRPEVYARVLARRGE
jgi:hypothetical protein